MEIGGVDGRVGLWNPPLEMIGEICEQHSQMFLRVAAMAPAVRVRAGVTRDLGGDVREVEIFVENEGYLPTYVLGSAKKKLPFDVRVFAEAECEGGVLISAPRVEVGHLEGWGKGVGTNGFGTRSDGNTTMRRVTFTVKGKGTLRVVAKGLRVGAVEMSLAVG